MSFVSVKLSDFWLMPLHPEFEVWMVHFVRINVVLF